MKREECWKVSKNVCIVMTGVSAIVNVAVGMYIFYNVDVNGVVQRINQALDAYGNFLPVAGKAIDDFNDIIQAMNGSVFQLQGAVNRLLEFPLP
jgi:hypothetical protein